MSTNEIHARLNQEADARAEEARRRLDIEALRRANARDDRTAKALMIVGGICLLAGIVGLIVLAVTR